MSLVRSLSSETFLQLVRLRSQLMRRVVRLRFGNEASRVCRVVGQPRVATTISPEQSSFLVDGVYYPTSTASLGGSDE